VGNVYASSYQNCTKLLASYPALLTTAYVSSCTNAGESLVSRNLIYCKVCLTLSAFCTALPHMRSWPARQRGA